MMFNEWKDEAACLGQADLFETEKQPGETNKQAQQRIAQAKEICNWCPVLHECALACEEEEPALSASHYWGVRAGKTPAERVKARKQKRQQEKREIARENTRMPYEKLKAPFPYYGGKSSIASRIWDTIGPGIDTYIEPFCGSAAMLLAHPPMRTEIINDLDGHVTNFWRAIRDHPEDVARACTRPLNEIDLAASTIRVQRDGPALINQLAMDIKYSDPELAGLWVYSINARIGQELQGPQQSPGGYRDYQERKISETGRVSLTLPAITAKHGIFRVSLAPDLTPGERLANITSWFTALAQRLENTKITCGHWERTINPHWTKTPTAIFLDPPYEQTSDQKYNLTYSANHATGTSQTTVSQETVQWCIENGEQPNLRIILCGYDGTSANQLENHGWTVHAWKANGEHANRNKNPDKTAKNNTRERFWASPGCTTATQTLF